MARRASARCAEIAIGILCAGFLVPLGTSDAAVVPAGSTGARSPQTQPVRPTHAAVLRGITAPRRIAEIGSLRPERITRIEVTEGCFVERGTLLVMLEDGVQRVQTEIAEALAQSTLKIDLARTLMERDRIDLERLRQLNRVDQASRRELQDAQTGAESSRLEYEIVCLEHEQAVREYRRQKALLEQLSIRAPFDGYVSALHKQVGETVDQLEDIITVVQLDPLEVWLDCPVRFAGTVHRGDRVPVRPIDPQWPARVGEVILTNRVIDAASQTFKIKLTVSNEDAGWMSGLKVTVDLGAVQPRREATGPSAPGPAAAAAPRDADRTDAREMLE